MLYQSLKLTNGIWVLAELKIQPPNPNFVVIITFVVQYFIQKNVCVCACVFVIFFLRPKKNDCQFPLTRLGQIFTAGSLYFITDN